MTKPATAYDPSDPLVKAITAIDPEDGQAATARALGVTPGLVWQWLNKERPLAPKHCPRLEQLSGVRCEQLRSDVVWTRDRSGQVTGFHVPIRH